MAVLHAPLLAFWLLIDRRQCVQGDAASVQEQLPEVVHQLWYTWHAALWDCSRSPHSPSVLTQSSLSGLVASVLDSSRKSSLSARTTKSLQLRLAARHLSKCGLPLLALVFAAVCVPSFPCCSCCLRCLSPTNRPTVQCHASGQVM